MNNVSTFLTDFKNDLEAFFNPTELSKQTQDVRASSLIMRVAGVATGILASSLFLKTIAAAGSFSVFATFSGLSLTIFTAILAHDLIQVGMNQSCAISITTPLSQTTSIFQKAYQAGKAAITVATGENYELEGTYLFKPIRDFAIKHSQNH